ncbi:DNA-binding transcriptional regulator, MurR/RpiR family, contains HTH and SIS domains [Halolactibacillus halophilus]|uniref:DNA-binding transcriptional regulator, MurR/RpiR family, contains HTH and SIS domains n=1 Tax=Halolactibacillus halophilus TaxID=306540 RepID=A0A1I5Q5Z3_9BACI|nr:MurR/RpiR family transcriptional regulator [Halolactibacillus halophilus]GEM01619.1 RpiR family transcriptional regulator [Halolactibacillus halophilus]SFP41713.1 DNA-binding transcriptional regulator, MurR/RpiR family, contains HTH and SIS domains [Halolactibacillus halophilus]
MYRVIHQLKERNFDRTITKSEKAVLDYLEAHFNQVPNYTVVKIARESYTSQATINRTAKLLGFKGFSELKYAIKEDVDILSSETHTYIRNTEYILSKINFSQVDTLVKHLYQHRRTILIFGLGASSVSAQYMARQFLYFGIPAIVVSELQMLNQFKGYTLLILSSSGETQRCLQMLENAKRADMYILSITKKDSSISENSMYSFVHDVPVDKMNSISREQQLHIILMINEVINKLKLNDFNH